MVKVSIDVRSGATRFDVAVQASSSQRVLSICQRQWAQEEGDDSGELYSG